MPGLLRGVARTAAIAGTATAVSNRVSRRQANRWAAKDQQQYDQSQGSQDQPPPRYEQQQAYEPPPAEPAPADTMTDKLAQLQQLGELKSQGVLTQAEFDEQKRRILG